MEISIEKEAIQHTGNEMIEEVKDNNQEDENSEDSSLNELQSENSELMEYVDSSWIMRNNILIDH